MGAWGMGSFDNDGASDWLADFEDRGAAAVTDAFDDLEEQCSDGYAEVDAGQMAIAAAEAVAAAFGAPIPDADDQLKGAFDKHANAVRAIDGIRERAVRALGLVTQAETSELAGLWDEQDELGAFEDTVRALAGRIERAV
jgi:hypothetical protein